MNGTTSKKPLLKGQAAVALASAAGVILASRMSRAGLLLTAGAAWWLWRRSSPAEALPFENHAVEPEDGAGGQEPAGVQTAEATPVFPPAPARQGGVDEGLWSELRAAIQPAADAAQDGQASAPEGQ